MAEVARADDQHTVILGHIGTLAVNPYIFDKLPYDPNKDFKPVSLLAKVPSLYVVQPDLPAKNLKEFVALAKAKPGELNYGSAGNGSAGHLAFEYLKMASRHLRAARAVPRHRPAADRPAGRPAGRRVGRRAARCCSSSRPASCAASPPARRSGSPQLPDVPTVAEQGFPGFEMTQWYGLLAPARLAAGARRQARGRGRRRRCREPGAVERFDADAAIAVGRRRPSSPRSSRPSRRAGSR